MAFLHVALLGGALSIALPIVLHLIMRQQPRHVEFPALRFIKQRETANRRQVKFRHLLLLALRCGVLLFLALALARPSIVGSGVLGDQEAPVAAALVFDTDPRMQYRQQNQSRLEVAQETALWLVPQLPAESDVAVVDSRTASAVFSVDAGAARQRIERLNADSMSQPLALSIEAALKLVRESQRLRKEIYIFSDLASTAWSPDATRELNKRLAETMDVGIYVIDVGAKDPQNYGVDRLQLSGDVVSQTSALRLGADVTHIGAPGPRELELYLLDRQSRAAATRGRQALDFASGPSQHADFVLRGLVPGVHQGYVKLVGQDALQCDDQRWFTIEVRPPWKVLIVTPQDAARKAADYALFLSQALAPHAQRVKGEAAFACEVIGSAELTDAKLDAFGAVCLVDPRPLEPGVWQKLHAYVSAGGGLGIFLGRNASPAEAFNEPLAQELLPGPLTRQWNEPDGVYLAPQSNQHPVLAYFRGITDSIPWEVMPVFRHWQIAQLADGAAIVAAFSNNRPAIVDRPIGRGRVVTLTTPVSDPNRADAWNQLPTGEGAWPFQKLMQGMVQYLVGSAQQRLNYLAHDTAIIRLGPGNEFPIYVLDTPRGDLLRTPVDEKQNALIVTSTETPGNYRLRAGGGQDQANLGFSVNLPGSVSQLARVSGDELQAVFGDTPFRLAASREEIDRSVSAGRVGQELYPYLIVLVVLLLAGEQVLSNRFYQDYDTSKQRSKASQLAAKLAAHEQPPTREREKTPVGGS
jgi:hypothetical protein